jgi:hypothetical protein
MMVEQGSDGSWTTDTNVSCAGKQEIVFSANDPLIEKISIAVYPGTTTGVALNSTAAELGLSWQETTVDGEGALWNVFVDVGNKQRTDTVNIRYGGKLYVLQYWFSTATTYVNENEIYFQAMVENMKFL